MKTPIISFVTILLFSFVLESCERTNKLVHTATQLIKENHIILEKDLSVCLIIPEAGCGDCIAGGVHFLIDNQDKFKNTQKYNKVIFTAVTSKKMLLRTLQIDSIESLYHEIDTLNHYLLPGELGIYPVVLYLKQGKIVAADVQSPDNVGTLQRLQDRLNNTVHN